jgi:hypothetical protein
MDIATYAQILREYQQARSFLLGLNEIVGSAHRFLNRSASPIINSAGRYVVVPKRSVAADRFDHSRWPSADNLAAAIKAQNEAADQAIQAYYALSDEDRAVAKAPL